VAGWWPGPRLRLDPGLDLALELALRVDPGLDQRGTRRPSGLWRPSDWPAG